MPDLHVMDWIADKSTWPHSEKSRFVNAAGTRWHVQAMGQGPTLLMLHGSGATTHSFAAIMPLLARHFSVVALDLPGHGFTAPLPGRPTLDGVSDGIAALLDKEALSPALALGHSAGAAICAHMAAKRALRPQALVSINGAFYPFPGLAGSVFPLAAKLLFLNPVATRLFAFAARNRRQVENLINSTGSKLDDVGLGLYQRAISNVDHVEGTLSMMANWDLDPLAEELRSLDVPVFQVIGGRDGTIDPAAADRTASLLKRGHMHRFPALGHLCHEEDPEGVADVIVSFARSQQIV